MIVRCIWGCGAKSPKTAKSLWWSCQSCLAEARRIANVTETN